MQLHISNKDLVTTTKDPIYKTYYQLIEDLRAQQPEQLMDIFFILICPDSIQPLINCGHQLNNQTSWKVDQHSHMGLLSQIVMEFPQLNAHVLHLDENTETQQANFNKELEISIPPCIKEKQLILSQAFEHHFF